jgi:hypothetical protein
VAFVNDWEWVEKLKVSVCTNLAVLHVHTHANTHTHAHTHTRTHAHTHTRPSSQDPKVWDQNCFNDLSRLGHTVSKPPDNLFTVGAAW